MPYSPEFFANNKDRFAHYGARYRDQLKAEMIEAYGGKCIDCGITDPLVLTLDHINDDSHVEKEIFQNTGRGGHKVYALLKKQGWPKERFQLLCCNCNARKEHLRRRAAITEINGEIKISTPETRSRAHANIGLPAHNKSGIKGVFWNKQRHRWQARVMVQYKNVHLGFFTDLREAAHAYRDFAVATWGADARYATEEEIDAAMMPVSITASSNPEDLGL